ncbi:MAG: RcnB family protein [Sphingobium sp.]
MRKIIMSALMAASVIPAIAMPVSANAQSRELRHDRQDIRDQRQDVRDAQRHGDRRDVRDERRDLRDSKKEYRQDWRDYRKDHRNVYSRGNWNAPFRYRTWSTGVVLRPQYYASRYYINDPWRYRLDDRGRNFRWVRNYDDVMLVNVRNGRVVEVYRNFFW